MARVKDVIVDDGWRMKPVAALHLLIAMGLGGMILFNALSRQPASQVALASPNTPGMVADGQTGTTVVLKFNPLIEETQRQLLGMGIYKGPVDGVNAPRTKTAIQQYQQVNGLAATGDATPELLEHMKFTSKVQAAAEFTGSTGQAIAPATATPMAGSAAVSGLAVNVNAATLAKAQNLSVKKVQVTLAGLGYEIKTLDGQVSTETRAAILKYQMDNGLDMSGFVDNKLLAALKVE